MTTTAERSNPTSPDVQPRSTAEQYHPEVMRWLLESVDTREKLGKLDQLNANYHEQKESLWEVEFDRLRAHGDKRPGHIVDAEATRNAEAIADGQIEQYIDAELMPVFAAGIPEDDPHYEATRVALQKVADMPPKAWSGEQDPDTGHSVEGLSHMLGQSIDAAEQAVNQANTQAAPDQERDEAFENAQAKLNEAREALAKLAAKRQGSPINIWKKSYAKAKEAYDEAMRSVGRMSEAKKEAENPGRTFEEKNVSVLEYIFDEQKKLRDRTLELLQGTKVHKMIELYDKYINSGPKWARVFKNAGLGLGISLVGGALVGLTGGLAGTAVAGGIVVARSARAIAKKEAQLRKDSGAKDIDEAEKNEFLARAKQAQDTTLFESKAYDFAHSQFEKDIRAEEKNRRKSVVAGIAGVAIGGALGSALSAFADNADWTLNNRVSGAVDYFKNALPHQNDVVDAVSPDGHALSELRTREFYEQDPSVPAHSDDVAELANSDHDVDTGIDGKPDVESFFANNGEFSEKGLDNFSEWVNGHAVRPGESIWSLSEDYLKEQGIKHPSIRQIDAVKDVVVEDFAKRGITEGVRGSDAWLYAGDIIKTK